MPFGKGSRHAPEGCVYTDRVTGAAVRQLTDHPSVNHPTYFLQSSFTPDGKALVFRSGQRATGEPISAASGDGRSRDREVTKTETSDRPITEFKTKS